jgi:two-component system chemotaxis response regulator CheY
MADFDFSHLTALIIEDSDFVRRVVRRFLSEMGFQNVLEASNGMDGIAELKNAPDVIICDIMMEPLNGFEFLKLLRKQPGREKALPVLFMTGSADAEDVQRAIKLGVSGYTLKPVMPDVLRKKLTEIMLRAMTS